MTAPWQAWLLTLYPDMFPGPLAHSLAGRARERGLWDLETVQIRDYAEDRHASVDDTPFGGGAGMVIRPDVLGRAIDATRAQSPIAESAPLVYLSPRGRPFTQEMAREFAACEGLVMICGRFEGVDQRVLDARDVREVSIGDFVLSGGEPAALVVLDTVLRLLPGVMGNPEALREESFAQGLLEYPQFTRPQAWEGRSVPEVLLSGHHKRIATWRRERAEELTKERRPDMWARYTEAGGEAGSARKDVER